ncbi:MAG TPA: hypothetical protein PL151_00850 [Phycisphaerae bacterium]|nr:hypothetical protein [Phycisphaerae bacterium]HOJ72593.1 hypothetical protein [Phycisphaerae bacterium]HOM49746.1 hypothetical protein [Phycisphaerae bacterium]HON64962.1 hypothetical protein [Phycisphaerae bacterium]HOQ84809.1 hypothetical protein [Phycisphaerae bacterium]
MLQCSNCEYCVRGSDGQISFTCNPLSTIKEPECLVKWQLFKLDMMAVKLDVMVRSYQATVEMYKRLAPLQEKMFRHMQREIEEMEDADAWKLDHDESDEFDDSQDR